VDFVYDSKGEFHLIDTAWMMIGGVNLKYLTCILIHNFSILFSDNFTDWGVVAELKESFFQKIPIKTITDNEELPFVKKYRISL
jgi:hypothetical protein